MTRSILNFFDRYRDGCEKFNRGPVHIPKPDPKNGIPGESIILMFINERPGRVGPGKSDLISFENNDPTAARFKRLFDVLGIDRKKIFITNACIYYPLRKKYKDTAPTAKEINFSAQVLSDQIERVSPKIIVPLGNTALRTLKKFIPELKDTKLKTHAAKAIESTMLIFPLYHTSNRTEKTRREPDQKRDWGRLKKLLSNP